MILCTTVCDVLSYYYHYAIGVIDVFIIPPLLH